MKNVDELYEKYYNACKNYFDNDDDLIEAKKKKLDYKQFELFDKTDKKLTLDGETKHITKEIENIEKRVDKNGFTKYFSYEPTALVNNLLSQNKQDLRKNLTEIKQQKIKLKKYVRNSANNKNKYDELNNILSVINRIDQFFEYIFLLGEQPDELKLPKWVNVNKKKIYELLITVNEAKNDRLEISVDGRKITLDNSQMLLKDRVSGKIDGSEFKKEYNNIADDVENILKTPRLTRSQNKMVEMLLLLKEIPKLKKSDEQPDTADMPELESEESAAKRMYIEGQGLKVLTPDKKSSRLPTTLAQLRAGNNFEKLINEIRQLLYYSYRSKKLTKQLCKSLINAIFKNGNNLYEHS